MVLVVLFGSIFFLTLRDVLKLTPAFLYGHFGGAPSIDINNSQNWLHNIHLEVWKFETWAKMSKYDKIAISA